MQTNEVFYVNQTTTNVQSNQITPFEISAQFQEFIKDWVIDNHFYYREQLLSNCGLDNYFVKVNYSDIESFSLPIAMEIRIHPLSTLPLLEEALRELYLGLEINRVPEEIPPIQLMIDSQENPTSLRQLKSDDIGKMVKTQGTIVTASKAQIKGKILVLECRFCKHQKRLILSHGFCSVQFPQKCEKKTKEKSSCADDPYIVLAEKSTFIDFQTLKIQESNDNMPIGEIPRTFRLCCERELVDKMVPGSKVVITGAYAINEKKSIGNRGDLNTLKAPYIYILGFSEEDMMGRRSTQFYTPAEEATFIEMSKDPKIFDKITDSIAPGIFGHREIKEAVACLLFAGSTKILPDKTRLRGDINVLLIGDPSTAKSQFLKFVHRVAPICVYTSGKGSSAAGLTAAIIQNKATREFHLEGGALVLADGGVVCIDEFDKMRAQDRVAIHEAMEQQTISIAKAGITTILNSRAAIFAASNPIFGRINESMSFVDQIDFKSTILSRFDCVFYVRDIRSVENDKNIAHHIVNMHLKDESAAIDAEIPADLLKKYIAYCRSKCFPRLTEEISTAVQDLYVEKRSQLREHTNNKKGGIPMTVRQLEALIRLSEAIAKTRLSSNVIKSDVQRANRIFEISTENSIKLGIQVNASDDPEVTKIEQIIKNVLPLNTKTSYQGLIEQVSCRVNNSILIERVIGTLINEKVLKQLENQSIKRINN